MGVINVRLLEFTVNKQLLRKKRDCDFSHIVAGSVGYLYAKFYFSQEEWSGCKKVVSFWKDDSEYPILLDDDNSCLIPTEVLGKEEFKVSVTGARSEKYRIETGKVRVRQEVY